MLLNEGNAQQHGARKNNTIAAATLITPNTHPTL